MATLATFWLPMKTIVGNFLIKQNFGNLYAFKKSNRKTKVVCKTKRVVYAVH